LDRNASQLAWFRFPDHDPSTGPAIEKYLELSPISRDLYSEISSVAAVFRNSSVAQLFDFLGEGGSARKYYAVLEQLSWRRDSNQMASDEPGAVQ
jgi:hypothetical protein